MISIVATEHNNACWANLAVNSVCWLMLLTIRVALGHKPSSPRGCDLVREGCCPAESSGGKTAENNPLERGPEGRVV